MGLNFRTPVFEDKDKILSILNKRKTDSFSQVFGSYFLWADEPKTEVCLEDGVLYVKYNSNVPKYEMPKGASTQSELKAALELIFEDAHTNGNLGELKFTRLLVDEAKNLEELFPKKLEIVPVRNDFEYVYSAMDLANLKGKKYHSKRNHISGFTKKHDWKYEFLDISKKDRYYSFFEKWFKSRSDVNLNELTAIEKTLTFYKGLDMRGGAVTVGDMIVACTIGERINDGTFLVHFEKALPEFAKAYAVINNQFCKSIVENGYKFVNREEDLGIEGLRKAKLSYHPCKLIEKYDAVLKNS